MENNRKKLPPHFYLVGGTALALQLGNRISDDFDFFCDNAFDTHELYTTLTQDIFTDGQLKIIQESANTLDILNESQVKLSFIRYRYKLIYSLIHFEAVVNAVAHRDYSVYGSKIRLHLFADRLEIFSPGTIPNTMTIDSLSERQFARNELLTSLLARCPMNVNAMGSQRSYIMDKRGKGVPIILTESEQLAGVRPEYRLLDDAELKLTVFAAPPPLEQR